MLQAGLWATDMHVGQQQPQAGKFWGLEKVFMVLIQPNAQLGVDGLRRDRQITESDAWHLLPHLPSQNTTWGSGSPCPLLEPVQKSVLLLVVLQPGSASREVPSHPGGSGRKPLELRVVGQQ